MSYTIETTQGGRKVSIQAGTPYELAVVLNFLGIKHFTPSEMSFLKARDENG